MKTESSPSPVAASTAPPPSAPAAVTQSRLPLKGWAKLPRRFGIVRFGPAAPALPVAPQVPDPIAAAPALDGSIKAFSPAAQVRAREAPVGSQVGRQLDTRLRHPLSG